MAHPDRDRTLMQLYLVAGDDTLKHVEFADLATSAGLTLVQVTDLVRQLDELGLVKQAPYLHGGGEVRLTVAGVDRARYLALPRWRRLLGDRAVVVPLLAAVTGAVLGGLITSLVKWLFGLP